MRKLIFVWMVVLAVLAVLADGFLWSCCPIPAVTEANVAVAYRQNLPGVESEILYRRNLFGFRSLSMVSERKPRGVRRVLCIGASTTDQATQNLEDTWCGLLESALNAGSDAKQVVQTASYGRGGWTAVDLLAWARADLERYQADVVIVLMGVNDLAWHGGKGYSWTGLQDALMRVRERMNDDAAGCRRYSQLCRRWKLVKRNLKQWRAKEEGRVLEWHSENLPRLRARYRSLPEVDPMNRSPDPITEFELAMDGLLALLERMGTATVVLGQPVLWKPGMSAAERDALWFSVDTPDGPVRPTGAWLAREMERYNGVQRRLAERYGAAYVDLDAAVPKILDNYIDDCHYTDAGNRVVAAAVLPTLRQSSIPSPRLSR